MATRLASTLLALLACCHCAAQLTIEECYAKARDNYPTAKQYGLIDKAEAYNISNAAKGYLPQIVLAAQATYQSDVTKLPFDESLLAPMGISIPTLSKDQYKVTLDMSQTIWDGGGIRARQKATRAGAEAERRQTDVSLYRLRARVNQLFFGILLIEAQIEQNGLLQGVLQRNCKRTEAYIGGGVASDADLDALRVELLKARQDEAQLKHSRRAYAAMLGQLTGIDIADSTRLARPEAATAGAATAPGRPELALYEAQIRADFNIADIAVERGTEGSGNEDVFFVHRTESGERFRLPLTEQSLGTLRYFRLQETMFTSRSGRGGCFFSASFPSRMTQTVALLSIKPSTSKSMSVTPSILMMSFFPNFSLLAFLMMATQVSSLCSSKSS